MKIGLSALILCLCSVVAAAEPVYRASQLRDIQPQWEQTAKSIFFPVVEFRAVPWRDVLPELERLTMQHDPAKKGIRLFVPDAFKADFARIADTPFGIHLDRVSIGTVFIEMPPLGWVYWPVSAREVAVIPESAVLNDLSP